MAKKIELPLPAEAEFIERAESPDPFSVLGMHPLEIKIDDVMKNVIVVRAFLPDTAAVYVVAEGKKYEMTRMHDDFFQYVFPDRERTFEYELERVTGAGETIRFRDPYCFLPMLGQLDMQLIAEGNHHQIYNKLGAHIIDVGGVRGTLFAVWAPNAKRVSVVGEFNQWDGRRHQMRVRGASGVWEIFIPGLEQWTLYKYELKTPHGTLVQKADPYSFAMEMRPKTASVVCNLDNYDWGDEEWMQRRGSANSIDSPMFIYEVHLGSWMRDPNSNYYLSYRDLAHNLADYVTEMGYTHVELLPVLEHPLDASWGYQVTGYFAPTSRFGDPYDFMYFVDYLHQKGIGIILDWVPAHFPKDEYALARFDGTALYEHADPRQGEHRDWGTLIFNYGRNEVRNFLIGSALFWLDKYHLDGLRVDAVASMLYLDYSRQDGDWIPNQFGGRENLDAIHFVKQFNELCYKYFPDTVTIAEESTAWPAVSRPLYVGGLGFGLKWNMGWMNDILSYFSKDPVFRKYHQGALTFALLYAFTENFVLVISHDEVVHGKGSLVNKMPGDDWQKFANTRLLIGYMLGHPGKKMLFQGCDFGQWSEWNFDQSIDWHLTEYDRHKALQDFVKAALHIYRAEPSLYEIDFSHDGFEWIDFRDADNSVVVFKRNAIDPNDHLIFVCNFTPVVRMDYRIGVPNLTYYHEILNSDAVEFNGSGIGNLGGVQAEDYPSHGQPYSMRVTIPPLGVVVFKPE